MVAVVVVIVGAMEADVGVAPMAHLLQHKSDVVSRLKPRGRRSSGLTRSFVSLTTARTCTTQGTLFRPHPSPSPPPSPPFRSLTRTHVRMGRRFLRKTDGEGIAEQPPLARSRSAGQLRIFTGTMNLGNARLGAEGAEHWIPDSALEGPERCDLIVIGVQERGERPAHLMATLSDRIGDEYVSILEHELVRCGQIQLMIWARSALAQDPDFSWSIDENYKVSEASPSPSSFTVRRRLPPSATVEIPQHTPALPTLPPPPPTHTHTHMPPPLSPSKGHGVAGGLHKQGWRRERPALQQHALRIRVLAPRGPREREPPAESGPHGESASLPNRAKDHPSSFPPPSLLLPSSFPPPVRT